MTPGSEVLRLFEAKADGWAAKYAPDGPLAGRLAEMSAAVLRQAPVDARVLDLGCGTGELARALASAGLRVAGCDISARMLSGADRGECAGWVRLAPEWRMLPFASAAFDVVVAASVLEYVREPAVVLGECARVLRPGGVVLYTVPDLRHPVRWGEWWARRLAWIVPAAGYRAYLRASRQRHRLRWWLAASASAGLSPVSLPDRPRATLRLLGGARW
jgi:SAM-dependent methyltransferase